MNHQEIFDMVVRHLKAQGRRSRRYTDSKRIGSDFCAYRGRDGLKCAVGVLIPDELYQPWMECGAVWTLLRACRARGAALPAWLLHANERTVDFLRRLQAIHDSPGHWNDTGLSATARPYLEAVASEFDLDPAVLTECFGEPAGASP